MEGKFGKGLYLDTGFITTRLSTLLAHLFLFLARLPIALAPSFSPKCASLGGRRGALVEATAGMSPAEATGGLVAGVPSLGIPLGVEEVECITT